MLLTRVNGEECRQVCVSNRGLAYGDGVFTTVKVIDRQPQLWEAHQRRLERDCKRLALRFDLAALIRETTELCALTSTPAVLKIMLVRGDGERGYRPPEIEAMRILQATPWQPYPDAYYEQGIAVTVCRLPLSLTPALAGVKHLNRLEQVLARAEWGDGYPEGLMLDPEGYVIEGTMSNLFIVAGDELVTPALDRCGVAGVMREHLMNEAVTIGFKAREAKLRLDDLHSADGVFVCNALIGAWPLARIAEHDCNAHGFINGSFRKILKLLITE